jgi:SAM-dependent methyltransferase
MVKRPLVATLLSSVAAFNALQAPNGHGHPLPHSVWAASSTSTRLAIGRISRNVQASASQAPAALSVSWSATDDNPNDTFIQFDENHYLAMLHDESRTGLYLEAIQQRLAKHPPGTLTVLDIGTGPYAVLGLAAARAGARKVYCIEINAEVADRARQEIQWAESAGTISPGTVEVIEGFSTDVSLPEKVDVLVTEIAGSIASEEGVYATIRDAQARFMKRPTDPASFIPFSYETLGAPATDMCHHSGTYRGQTTIRVEAHDTMLQLLAEPRLVEDIRFADTSIPASGTIGAASPLVWSIDAARVAANEEVFRARLQADEAVLRAKGIEVGPLARDVSRSLSGIALWPRIVLDEAKTLVYDSRGPAGEHQTSHFPTFLPLLSERPAQIAPGDTVRATWQVDLQDGKVMTPLKYSMECQITPTAEAWQQNGAEAGVGAAPPSALPSVVVPPMPVTAGDPDITRLWQLQQGERFAACHLLQKKADGGTLDEAEAQELRNLLSSLLYTLSSP